MRHMDAVHEKSRAILWEDLVKFVNVDLVRYGLTHLRDIYELEEWWLMLEDMMDASGKARFYMGFTKEQLATGITAAGSSWDQRMKVVRDKQLRPIAMKSVQGDAERRRGQRPLEELSDDDRWGTTSS